MFSEAVFCDVIFGGIAVEGLMMCVITAAGRVGCEDSRVGLVRLKKVDLSTCDFSAQGSNTSPEIR